MREMPGVHIDQNRCSHKSECAIKTPIASKPTETLFYQCQLSTELLLASDKQCSEAPA